MPASRRIVPLTLDNLDDLPNPCRSCLFWEIGPLAETQELAADEAQLAKEAWLSATLLDWGSCGKIAYVAGVPAGYAMFAPPGFVPRSLSFPTSPVSGDAVLLMNVRVLPEWASAGVGRMLAQAVAAELVPRGVKAIEAFGWAGLNPFGRGRTGGGSGNPSASGSGSSSGGGSASAPDDGDGVATARGEAADSGFGGSIAARLGRGSCLMPADYLRSVGFKTVRPHPYYPRLRMELKSTVSWRYDVEYALERIFGTNVGRSLTPVG